MSGEYKIIVRCTGRIFGTRESYLKRDGEELVYTDEIEAENYAKILRKKADDLHGVIMDYFVVPV